MTWVRVDEGMTEHPKVAQLSDAAFRVYVESLCYCNRNLTDGFVPTTIAHQRTKKRAAELVTAGVWDIAPGGYQIHDFHDYQPTKAEVLELREKRSAAGRAGAGKRWGKRDTKTMAKPIASAIAPAIAKPWQNDAPVPDPVPDHIPKEDQSSPSLVATDHLEIKDQTIRPGTAASIERLLARLPDADKGTVGRLVKFAKNGASQADFEDARAALAEVGARSPSRYACHVIAERLKERA